MIESTISSPEPILARPKAWILVDADRGLVLDARLPHTALPVASAAKLMTALLAVHRLGPDAMILVDAAAASRPPSKIGMKVGERWTRQDALEFNTVQLEADRSRLAFPSHRVAAAERRSTRLDTDLANGTNRKGARDQRASPMDRLSLFDARIQRARSLHANDG